MKGSQFAGMVDMVELSPKTTREMVDTLIRDACESGFHSVGCPYCYHSFAVERLKQYGCYGKVALLGGGGFADGNWPTRVKLYSISECLAAGCNEIDLTSNLGWIKSGMWKEYRDEIRQARSLVRGTVLKVIIHQPQLTEMETEKVCEILLECGIDYVKTDTGRSPGPTTLEHVKTLKYIVGDRMKIKASGGIRDRETVEAMKEAGADRIGMSHSSAMKIYREFTKI